MLLSKEEKAVTNVLRILKNIKTVGVNCVSEEMLKCDLLMEYVMYLTCM